MKILYIACHSHVGWGAEYFINEAFREQGVETVLYDYKSARKKLKPWWLINLELRKLVKKEKPQLLFLQRGRFMPAYALSGLNIPKVLWSTEPLQLKNCVNKLLKSRQFSWVFVHSYSCMDKVKEKFSHLLPNCSVMHNGCPKAIIDTSCEKSEFAVFNRTLSAKRKKWIEISQNLIRVESGKYGDEYFAALARAEVAPNIHFSDENVDDFETGIFEAMAKGCVVVSESLSRQTIEDLQIGDALIEVATPEEMQAKLTELKSNPSMIAEYSQRAYRAIEKNTWDYRVTQFITRFQEILSEQ